MATHRNRKHIIVPGKPSSEDYRPHGRKIDAKKYPVPGNRVQHGRALKQAFNDAVVQARQRRADAGIQVHGATPGLYVEFDSQPGVPLLLKSLEDSGKGIELVAVTYSETSEPQPKRIEHATVFVPEGKVKHFVKRCEEYSKPAKKAEGGKNHRAMLDPVASLRLATLRGLWTDSADVYPADNESIWWEVWLRRQDGKELERLMEFAGHKELQVADRRLLFDDRIVILLRATPQELSASIDVLNDLAEVCRAKETASVFYEMGAEEQADWTKELVSRTTHAGSGAPAVCLLDTGVSRGHPLLERSLAESDCHSCDPIWGTHDHDGHGTEMAGLAL